MSLQISNKFNFQEIKTALDNIEAEAAEVESNFKTIDNEIRNSVGPDGSAWDGVSAGEFLASWDQAAGEIQGFKTTLQNQTNNIKLVLEKMEATDNSGSGTIGTNSSISSGGSSSNSVSKLL